MDNSSNDISFEVKRRKWHKSHDLKLGHNFKTASILDPDLWIHSQLQENIKIE